MTILELEKCRDVCMRRRDLIKKEDYKVEQDYYRDMMLWKKYLQRINQRMYDQLEIEFGDKKSNG